MPATQEFVEFHAHDPSTLNWIWANNGDEDTTAPLSGTHRIWDEAGTCVYEGPSSEIPMPIPAGRTVGPGTGVHDPMWPGLGPGSYTIEVWGDPAYGPASGSGQFRIDENGAISV